ncbi:MAG: vanadium-dependent haloperoxidase [Parvularculaceae bacterium]|nr:vanadium-dependent haloperoxidase [Parvularculaceae bacterium]
MKSRLIAKSLCIGVASLAFAASAHAATGDNAVTRFMQQALTTVGAGNIGTPAAGRLYAMTTIAMYDAVNGIDASTGAVSRRRASALVSAAGAPPNGLRDVAAAAAAHAVLISANPSATRRAELDAALLVEANRFGGVKNARVAQSLEWGRFVGEEVARIRSVDGTQVAETIPSSGGIGKFPNAFNGAQFRNMTPFGVTSVTPFLSPTGPAAVESRQYALDAFEITLFGAPETAGGFDFDARRDDIAAFWFFPPNSITETGSWFAAAIEIAKERNTTASTSDTARLLARIGMSVADSVILSWTEKATYLTWRPRSAIREGANDGNPFTVGDPAWVTRRGQVGGTPEWTSGQSTFAGAGAGAIAEFYCTDAISFSFTVDPATKPARTYASLTEAAAEAAASRVFQGIHFGSTNRASLAGGAAIADEIARTRLNRVGVPNADSDCPRN